MCCPSVSGCFIGLSVVTYVSLFVLTLLNMIFSILTPKEFETFKYINYTNYNESVEASFLMDMKFGPDLVGEGDDYGYGSTGKKEDICIRGKCTINYSTYDVLNCSNACFENLESCYKAQTKCDKMTCSTTYSQNKEVTCKTYSNKINKWRNVGVAKIFRKFEYIPLQHIYMLGFCPKNYKKCGKLNIWNFLCLKPDDEYGCPINQIEISDTNTPPSTNFNYKSYKIGDKYIFYTNENVNGYLIQNLNHIYYENKGPAEVPNRIDSDTFKNILKYNPDTYSGKFSLKNITGYKEPQDNWTSFLVTINYNVSKYSFEMKELQALYEERNKLYSEENIKIMNENVKAFKGVLMGFGIASFASFACIGIFFIPIYSAYDCGKQCSKSCGCWLCQDITAVKRAFLFYLICSPTVFFSIFTLVCTLSKKSTYLGYLCMQNIDEYKNMSKSYYSYRTDQPYDHFEKSITYNDAQFIISLLILIFLILYSGFACCIPHRNEKKPSYENITGLGKNKNKDVSYNSTELMPSYNSESDENSHTQQNYNQGYGYQAPNYQPNIYPAYGIQQPQNQYQGEKPYYQQ